MHYWKIKTKEGVDRYVKTEQGEKPEVSENELAVRVPQSAFEMFNAIDIDMFKEHCYIGEFEQHATIKFVDGSYEPVGFSDDNPF